MFSERAMYLPPKAAIAGPDLGPMALTASGSVTALMSATK
jgi:hypothetical protein